MDLELAETLMHMHVYSPDGSTFKCSHWVWAALLSGINDKLTSAFSCAAEAELKVCCNSVLNGSANRRRTGPLFLRGAEPCFTDNVRKWFYVFLQASVWQDAVVQRQPNGFSLVLRVYRTRDPVRMSVWNICSFNIIAWMLAINDLSNIALSFLL